MGVIAWFQDEDEVKVLRKNPPIEIKNLQSGVSDSSSRKVDERRAGL